MGANDALRSDFRLRRISGQTTSGPSAASSKQQAASGKRIIGLCRE